MVKNDIEAPEWGAAFGWGGAFVVSETCFVRIGVRFWSGNGRSDFGRLRWIFRLCVTRRNSAPIRGLGWSILPGSARRGLGECSVALEGVRRFLGCTRAWRLGLTEFFLMQIFSLQYFHTKLFFM